MRAPDDPDIDVCERKVRYPSKQAARDVARMTERRHNAPKLYVYACDNCRGFHLTKMNPELFRAARRSAAEGQ